MTQATEEEKKIAKEIMETTQSLVKQGKHDEAKKYLMQLKKKYEPTNSNKPSVKE